jgi:hypothetical protein
MAARGVLSVCGFFRWSDVEFVLGHRVTKSFRLSILAAVAVGSIAGCGGETATPDDLTSKYLSEIGQAYMTFLIAEKRQPKSLDEIRQTLQTLHLADYASDPELVMRSPRDGQPFVVILGAASKGDGGDDKSTIWAYEQTGADGKRYVLMLSGDVKLLTDGEFAGAKFAAGHKPAKI